MKRNLQLRFVTDYSYDLVVILCLFIFVFVSPFSFYTQSLNDSLIDFNFNEANKHASFYKSTNQKNEFLKKAQQNHILETYFNQNHSTKSSALNKQNAPCAACENIDFEDSTTNGWLVTGVHRIVKTGVDPFGKFPVVFPGAGKYSLMLNSNKGDLKSNLKSSLKRTIKINSQNDYLNLHFAMVLLDFPHDKSVAAQFKIFIRDSNNQILPCPQFNCYYSEETGAVGVKNFSTSAVKGLNIVSQEFPVSYSSWQSIGLDLSAFIGSSIQLEIECNWCKFNYDWAYCYIDADCIKPSIPVAKCSSFPTILNSYSNMQDYRWLSPDGSTLAIASPSLAASVSGVYTLQGSFVNNCFIMPSLFYFNVTLNPKAEFASDLKFCNLNTKFISLSSKKDVFDSLTYKWQLENNRNIAQAANINYTFNSPGSKMVKHMVFSSNGCADSITKRINVSAPVHFTILNQSGTHYLNEVDDQLIFKAVSNYTFADLTYRWIGKDFAVVSPSVALKKSGQYMVIGQDPKTLCADTNWLFIDIASKLEIPNVFTPNNDGTNDEFKLITENIKSIFLVICDRWGNKVFEKDSNSGNISWNGKNKIDKDCADGVFFYVIKAKGFDGVDYQTNGTVSLFR